MGLLHAVQLKQKHLKVSSIRENGCAASMSSQENGRRYMNLAKNHESTTLCSSPKELMVQTEPDSLPCITALKSSLAVPQFLSTTA